MAATMEAPPTHLHSWVARDVPTPESATGRRRPNRRRRELPTPTPNQCPSHPTLRPGREEPGALVPFRGGSVLKHFGTAMARIKFPAAGIICRR